MRAPEPSERCAEDRIFCLSIVSTGKRRIPYRDTMATLEAATAPAPRPGLCHATCPKCAKSASSQTSAGRADGGHTKPVRSATLTCSTLARMRPKGRVEAAHEKRITSNRAHACGLDGGGTVQALWSRLLLARRSRTRLHEDVDDVAILIDGTPEIVPLSLDGDEDLVQVPCVAQPALSTLEPASVFRTELDAPKPDRFVEHRDAALGPGGLLHRESSHRIDGTAIRRG